MKLLLGFSPNLVVIAAATVLTAAADPPPLAWRLADEGWGRPAADDTTVFFTTPRHEVVAVDIETGRQRWRAPTQEPGEYTLGYGAVIVGSVVVAGDYSVVAFDRVTGVFKWRFDPVEGHAPGAYIGQPAGDRLLTGSAGGRLHAVHHETGKPLWSAVAGNAGITTVFAPIASGGLAIAGFTEFSTPNRGGVIAADLATGNVRWRRMFPLAENASLGTNSVGGPVIYQGTVLATSADGTIYALDRENGEVQWSLPRLSDLPPGNPFAPDRDFRALAISGTTLMAGSLTGVIVGFDLTSRREKWRFHVPLLVSASFAATADDNTFYLPFFSGIVVAIDAATGVERWRVGDWKAGFIWVPLVWKDRLFMCATREGLFAFQRGAPAR